ncbi:MAG: hypothetical protein LBJ62_01470 [Bifidobacteriaceae bacterium]|jgi:hypothetical protein|nr:hypothetical protein [Bifidobacteriaceae bacterium]
MTEPATLAEFNELLRQIDATNYGRAERALIDQAVALAQTAGDEELEYLARMRLTSSAAVTGDSDTQLSSFAWCIARYDADPGKFPFHPPGTAADIMFQYKWMVATLDRTAKFPLERAETMLNDMEDHYRRAGLGPSGVLTARFIHAWRTGQTSQAADLESQVVATPRDSHSHCDACIMSDRAAFACETGRPEFAIQLVEEIIERNLTCGEEPEYALSRTILAYLRAGQLKQAAKAHLRSYQLSQYKPDLLEVIADHVTFCAISGNETRSCVLLRYHLAWLSHDSLNDWARFRMLQAVWLALTALDRFGWGSEPIMPASNSQLAHYFGSAAPDYTVRELIDPAWTAAETLAQAFDARNGNSYASGLLNATADLRNERYTVPLTG